MSERSKRAAPGRRGNAKSIRSASNRRIIKKVSDRELRSVRDGYNNVIAKLGNNEANALSTSYYNSSRLSTRWQELTVMYREGWLTKKIIDIPAEDMTKAWISFDTQMEQDAVRRIEREMRQFRVQKKMTEALRWSRLYGGSLAIILIEGEEDMMDKPLDLVLVMPGTFRGLIVKDRWDEVSPSMELVTDMMDADYGFPKYYDIGNLTVDAESTGTIRVHHSRVIRLVGRELPHSEEEAEMYWGASELEHVFDELNKRNATSANIAQLVFQANLRVLKMSDLGQLLAMSDERTQRELYQTIQAQNMLMTSFGMQVMDSADNFETHPYSFAGLNDIYQSFQSDIAGAAEIPATKLFGKSPDGMNSTGESDLTNYYDSIRQKQENVLRPGLEKLLPVVCVSALGVVPDDIEIVFEPVESTTDAQRAGLATQVVSTISGLFQADLYSKPMALNELRKASYVTGIGSVITDEDIEKAEKEAELMAEQNAMGGMMGGMMPGMPGAGGGPQPGQPAQAQGPEQAEAFPKAPGAPEEQQAEDALGDEKSVAIQGIRDRIDSIDKLRKALYSLDAYDPGQKRDEDGKWTSDGGGSSSKPEPPKPKADAGWVKAAREVAGLKPKEEPSAEPSKPTEVTKQAPEPLNPLDTRSDEERKQQYENRGDKNKNTSGLTDDKLEKRATGRYPCIRGFGSPERMQNKLGKHVNEWEDLGVTDVGQIAKRAFKLASSKVGGNILGYVRGNGTIVRYDKENNEWIAHDPDKVIITFMRPGDGIAYYEGCRSREEWTRQK